MSRERTPKGRRVACPTKDRKRLEDAEATLARGGIGDRIMIVDRQMLGENVTASSILAQLHQLKERTGTKRGFVMIDYLQRIPVPAKMMRQSDLEADRYRVQVVQDLAEATKTPENPAGDAVMVISETRKPSGRAWGNNLSDLMGSARLPYAVDAAMLFQPMDDADIRRCGWPTECGGSQTFDDLQKASISPVRLEMVKGRDGMQHGEWGLAFYFKQSRFKEVTMAARSNSMTRGCTFAESNDVSFRDSFPVDPFPGAFDDQALRK